MVPMPPTDSEESVFGITADTTEQVRTPEPSMTAIPLLSPEPTAEHTPIPTDIPTEELLPTPGSLQEPENQRDPDTRIKEFLDRMTLEEKVAQLFIVTPEALTGTGQVTAAGAITQSAIDNCPVGGLIYMSGNLVSEEQCVTMLTNTQSYSMARIGLPMFLAVDEEGGTVARISGSGKFDVPYIGDMRDLGKAGDPNAAFSTGATIGSYLFRLGFNVDFAPVADVLSNDENTVVQFRSFGTDPKLVAQMAIALSAGLESENVLPVYKHFPGHGATAGDTHNGYAYTNKTLEQLRECELFPFQECINNGAKFIMVAHISLPNITGDDIPASLSSRIITDLLRDEMGYEGIVITDALNMGAIVDQFSSSEAAVMAIQAGADIILMPSDFNTAYQGVLDAVYSGIVTESRIDESVMRILKTKLEMNY